MKYEDVIETTDKKSLLLACAITDKSPQEIVRKMRNPELNRQAELWSKMHYEYGELVEVKKDSYEQGDYKLTVKFDTGKKQKDGTTFKSARTGFLSSETVHIDYLAAKKKNCRFYISYALNKETGGVYRQLIDFDVLEN